MFNFGFAKVKTPTDFQFCLVYKGRTSHQFLILVLQMATISPIFNAGFTKAETPADFHFFVYKGRNARQVAILGLQGTRRPLISKFGLQRARLSPCLDPKRIHFWSSVSPGSEKDPLFELIFAFEELFLWYHYFWLTFGSLSALWERWFALITKVV